MPMLSIAVLLFVLGLALGSFINALVWRLHENSKKSNKNKKVSILTGRSMCPYCRHTLEWYDLVPVVSWVTLGGRCRYCRKPISTQYPAVELTMAFTFALSYIFWPHIVHLNGEWLLIGAWLATSVGLLALLVYDVRWMILPNKIIYPTLLLAVTSRIVYVAAFASRPWHALALWGLSVAIASGPFYILFIVSQGKWIGFGDIRLGLITGTLLAQPYKSLAMIFLASVLGTIVVLPGIFNGKKTMASKIPYGPFLISATAILVVFGDGLINWYKNLFGL